MSQQMLGGRYRLLSVIGTGGFGQVWTAYDETLRVEVAIKQIRLDPTAPDSERANLIARAEREARNAAKLRDHPNIVAVHDVVVADGAPWLVMQLVKGHSLAEELNDRGPIPAEQAARIAAAVLSAFSAAHAAGIIHRDVKPSNVLLAQDGSILLVDFGIAKHHADTAQTSRGAFIGSLPYSAPERLKGLDLPVGDLFALGATLYEAVEGTAPFAGGTPAQVLGAVALAEPAPPRNAGPLSGLILALLNKDPDQRPDAQGALASLTTHHPDRGHTALSSPTLTAWTPPPPPPQSIPLPSTVPPDTGPPGPVPRKARRLSPLAWIGGAIAVPIISILVYAQLNSTDRSNGGHGLTTSSSGPSTATKAATAPTSSGPTSGLASFYVGTWTGTVGQYNHGVHVGEANIELVLTGGAQGQQVGTLTARFLAFSCTGDLTLTSTTSNGTVGLLGHPTGGTCLDFDVTLTRTSSSSISYNTQDANHATGVSEAGTLTRS